MSGLDLDAARRDVGAFAAMVGHPLAGFQVESLRLEAFMTALLAPRGAGKSTCLGLLAAWRAFTLPGHRVLVVSASEEGAKRLLAQVRGVVLGFPPLAASVVDEQSMILRLENGSEVRCTSASERSIRGWRAGTLIIDEAGRLSDELIESAALPVTSATPGARVLLADTAGVTSGVFYDACQRGLAGSETTRLYRWALESCGWISPTYIAQMRETMSPLRWQAEMECSFVGESDAMFSRRALADATADYRVESLAGMRGPARLMAGVDWGATVDRSALVGIGRVVTGDPEERRFAVAVAHAWPAGAPLHRVIADVADSPAHFTELVAERNGLGEACAQELARQMARRSADTGGGRARNRLVVIDAHDLPDPWDRPTRRSAWPAPPPPEFRTAVRGMHTSAAMKSATYAALRLMLDEGRLLLPMSASNLLRELLLLRIELTSTGERIEARSGHDDLADALMLALGPYKTQDGRWKTRLRTLVEARRLPAPWLPGLPPTDLEMVASGGGVRIPRRPVWASVSSSQVTSPPGFAWRPVPRINNPYLPAHATKVYERTK